jgi:hypothetical protein
LVVGEEEHSDVQPVTQAIGHCPVKAIRQPRPEQPQRPRPERDGTLSARADLSTGRDT